MKKEHRTAARGALIRAFAEGRAPNFAEAELADWIKVADDMIVWGELDVALHAVRCIREAWPNLAWGQNVAELIARIPPVDPEAPPFSDDLSKAMNVIARDGADTAILVFGGGRDRVGMPPPMLHRWLSIPPASLIYLRDPLRLAYLGGVPDAGADMATTIASLRTLIQELGASRVICYGNSIGGYGALRYGLELGANAVFSMAGLVNLQGRFNAGLHYDESAQRIEAAFPEAELDLRELYRSTKSPPATWIVYGEHNWDDRIHAEYMAGVDGITLTQIGGSKDHNVAAELIRAGQFQAFLGQARTA